MTSLTSSLPRFPLAVALALLLSLVVADSPPASAADDEDASSSGDLDITDDLTITGAGEAVTIIDGGGLDRVFHVIAGTVEISGATIQNGVVSPDDDGGGIRNQGTLTLANVTVSDNTARAGGGIFNDPNATLTLDDTTVTSNTATTTLPEFGSGGGIANRGTLTGTDVTVSDNTATSGFGSAGGGISNVGDATLVNIAVIRNTSFTPGGGGAQGGGLMNWSGGPGETGDVVLTNATISGNSASNEGGFGVGGGINNQEALVLKATTITSNTASDGGGFEGTFSGQLTLKNTIIANNSGDDCAPFSKLTSEGHNLDSDGSCQLNAAGDRPNADPKLGPLADNGGPTQTPAILAGSPAIDAGDDTTCPTSDQRGFPRPQGTACDIGAYESDFAAAQPTPTPSAAQLPAGGGEPASGRGEGMLIIALLATAAVGLAVVGGALVGISRRG